MGVTIEIDSRDMARLNVEMNRLAEQTGKTLKEVLVPQMRLLATDFAAVTRSKGKNQGDKTIAEKRVAIRIREVYPSPGWVVNQLKRVDENLGVGFAVSFDKRKFKNCQEILNKHLPRLRITIGKFDNGALHEDQRWKRKVTRRLLITTAYSKIGVYTRKVQKRIGFAKAGFAAAAKSLGGTRGIPQWVKRHASKAPGSGTITGDGKTLKVTMTNNVQYLRKAFKPIDEKAALAHRAKQVTAVLKRIQDRKVKRMMRKMR